jgi:hypothetical protein
VTAETAVVLGLVVLVALVIALLLLAHVVKRAAAELVRAYNTKGLTGSAHTDAAHHLGEIAKSLDGIHRRDLTLQQRDEIAEKQEKLVLAVQEVLQAKFTHDPALRPDVIEGQDRGVKLVKDLLYDKLEDATK